MEVKAGRNPRIYLALVALAVLLGPAKFFLDQQVAVATDQAVTAGPALAGLFAGLILTGIGIVRRQPMLRGHERLAVLVLLLPQLADRLLHTAAGSTIPWLHLPGRGDALLLTLAAPLWLGLLAALQAVRADVPQVTIAAAIVALGAACLTLPLDSYTVGLDQLAVFAVQICLVVLTVWTWSFATERLTGSNVALATGTFLLLQTALGQVPALVVQHGALQPVDWRHAAAPLGLHALATAGGTLLWFWLVTRMSLAAFALHPLAAWIASTLASLALFGLNDVRVDVSFLVALAACIVGVRARTVDEQPIELELT